MHGEAVPEEQDVLTQEIMKSEGTKVDMRQSIPNQMSAHTQQNSEHNTDSKAQYATGRLSLNGSLSPKKRYNTGR